MKSQSIYIGFLGTGAAGPALLLLATIVMLAIMGKRGHSAEDEQHHGEQIRDCAT